MAIPRAAQTQRRTRIQEEKEELILEAALEVFSQRGFHGSTIDQIAEKNRHAPRMTPDTVLAPITEGIEQAFEGQCTTMNIANQVIATRGIEVHQSLPPPSRLPQPSLLRQTS